MATEKAAPVREPARRSVGAVAFLAFLLSVMTGVSRGTAQSAAPAADAVAAPLEPSGTNLVVPAGSGVAASFVLPACDAPAGTVVTLRALEPDSAAVSALGGSVIAAHEFRADHDLSCRALPSISYALPPAQQTMALVVEITAQTGATVGSLDQYRGGVPAFEGGMFPSTAASTESHFAANERYVFTLRAGVPTMLSSPVSLAPVDLTLPGAGELRFEVHVPAAIDGGGRIVERTSLTPPAGVPPLVTADGTPALAYLSAVVIGSATFGGEGRLAVGMPADRHGTPGLAVYDAERWTAGWTPLVASRSRDAAGRFVFTLPVVKARAVFKRLVLGVYPVPRRRRADGGAFASFAYVPPAGRPLVAIVGDSSVAVTVLAPSAVGCKLDFAPPPACQITVNPAVALPGRLAAALPDAAIVQLAWLATTVGDVPKNDSELVWQVPQIPPEATDVIFAGGAQDVVVEPAADLEPRLEAIVAAIRARAPHAHLVLVGLRYLNDEVHDPVRKSAVDAWDEREERLAATADGAFIDLRTLLPSGFDAAYPDGAHLTPESARVVARAILAQLERLGGLGRIVPP